MTIRPELASLADQTFDLIVIGAGINGAGIARDAAMRGLHVLLLDKEDIGGGTTSWSTRLIHGGLRYLEHAEIGLVRESLRERERLLRIAPHLVKPLPLIIPIYRGDRRGPWLIRLGMVAYDLLSYDKSLRRHRMLNRDQALRRLPGLNPTGLAGAAVYFDAQVEYAERLAVENALAAHAAGALLLTYAEVVRLVVEQGAVAGVVVRDRRASTETESTLRASIVLNVAGPWVDDILDAGEPTGRTPLIGGTKGSHIVVGAFPGAPSDALYVEARQDGRPFFIIPWNDQYLIGTTDSRYNGDPDDAVAKLGEIDYLLAETNRVLPEARLTRHDVHFAYAGVRPLPFRANGKEGREGAITRRHHLLAHAEKGGPAGLFSIVGGKLTTYRELSEQAVDAVYRARGQTAPRCRTAQVPLPGGAFPVGESAATLVSRLLAETELPHQSAAHLARVYGERAFEVVALAREPDRADLIAPFDADSGAIGAEVVYAFEREAAITLADCLLRRTMVGLGPRVGIGADDAAAAIAARHLGWDKHRRRQEIAAYRDAVERLRPPALAPREPSVTGV